MKKLICIIWRMIFLQSVKNLSTVNFSSVTLSFIVFVNSQPIRISSSMTYKPCYHTPPLENCLYNLHRSHFISKINFKSTHQKNLKSHQQNHCVTAYTIYNNPKKRKLFMNFRWWRKKKTTLSFLREFIYFHEPHL